MTPDDQRAEQERFEAWYISQHFGKSSVSDIARRAWKACAEQSAERIAELEKTHAKFCFSQATYFRDGQEKSAKCIGELEARLARVTEAAKGIVDEFEHGKCEDGGKYMGKKPNNRVTYSGQAGTKAATFSEAAALAFSSSSLSDPCAASSACAGQVLQATSENQASVSFGSSIVTSRMIAAGFRVWGNEFGFYGPPEGDGEQIVLSIFNAMVAEYDAKQE